MNPAKLTVEEIDALLQFSRHARLEIAAAWKEDSEKLAKAEAERDAFKKSAEVAHDVAISVARAMGIHEAVVSEGRLVVEVERLGHLAACQIRCEAKREAAEARAEAAEAAIEKATQSEYAASLDAENAKLGKLGVQFNDSKCQRPTCRAVEARAEAAEAALATARAVAMEEAARVERLNHSVSAADASEVRAAIRALAPLPAGLMVVPKCNTCGRAAEAAGGFCSSGSHPFSGRVPVPVEAIKRLEDAARPLRTFDDTHIDNELGAALEALKEKR